MRRRKRAVVAVGVLGAMALVLARLLGSGLTGPVEPGSPIDPEAKLQRFARGKERGSPLSPPRGAPAPPASPRPRLRPLTPEEIEAVRSEIRISLAALYGAEKSFYSEYRRYSTDIYHGIGYFPEGGQRWSKVGFLAPFSPDRLVGAEDPRYMDSDAFLGDRDISPELRFSYAHTGAGFSLGDYARFCRQGCVAGDQHFEIMAAARLVEGNDPDVWIIDDQKVIRHVHDGLTNSEPERE